MKRSIVLLLAFALSASAQVKIPRDDLFRLGFTPPELLKIHLDDLSLDAGQRERATGLLEASATAMPALEATMKEQGQALETLVTSSTPNPDEAEKMLDRVLDAEAAIKRLQLRTILGLHGVLTPEQRTKALELAKRDVELEASARALAERIRTALDRLDVKPTQAIEERGDQIKPLLESGKFAAAMEALRAAAEDFGIDEPVSEEPLDFSKFDAGIIELAQLQRRYADVEQRIRRVVRIPLLRQLAQAHPELEAAKAAQDAVAVGRILTWAEATLPVGQ